MSFRQQRPRRARGSNRIAPWVVERLEGRRLLSARLLGITGNQGNAAFRDETLYDVIIGTPGTSDPAILDGFEQAVASPPTTLRHSTTGASQGTGALRVDAPQGTGVFWGARSGNVIDVVRLGSTFLTYDLTLTGVELNGGAFGGGADNSFNGFAQNNELAVVINTANGFEQRTFTAAGNGDTSGQNAQWNGVDGVRQITWNLSAFTYGPDDVSIADFIAANNATDVRFWFTTQGGDSNGNVGPMRVYFDNIRVTTPQAGDTTIGDFELLAVSPIVTFPFVPDTDAIAYNPANGLLYRASGASSYRNDPTRIGYRDDHYMQTIDMRPGANLAQAGVFNANFQGEGANGPYGIDAPRPDWLFPADRRTDAQTDPAFGGAAPGEYHAARDFTWTSTEPDQFYVADEDGIFKLRTDGSDSVFVGEPAGLNGGPKGITFFTVGGQRGQRGLYVSERDGPNLYQIDPITGEIVGTPVAMTNASGTPIPGVLSLVESPDGTTMYGIARNVNDPGNAFMRDLIQIDPVTGVTTSFGMFGVHMADLAFVPDAPQVAGRHIFYNRSFWDGSTALVPDGPNDDAAIAPDKVALLPGQPASFNNVISFTKGITGVMVDIAGVGNAAGITAADFVFRVGAGGDPAAYTPAPAPSGIEVRTGQGVSGSDRVEIAWGDGAIFKQWLEVTVLANADTGLGGPDKFYFGNLPGEIGDNPAALFVNAVDVQRTRINQFQPAVITSVFDHNRDGGIINAQDVQFARINQFSTIALFTPPAALRIAGQDDEER